MIKKLIKIFTERRTIGICLFILLIAFLLPPVMAVTGGEEEIIYSFEECSNFTVDVIGEQNIENGEYLLKDCILVGVDKWSCECDGIYDLILTTKINTINKYNFTINYSYQVNSTIDLVEVKLENKDIIIKEMVYIGNVLELELEGDGNKTVMIYVGDLSCPYKVLLNDINIVFICDNNYITFDAVFSTNNVKLNYNFPVIEPESPSTSGGGGGSGGGYVRDGLTQGSKTLVFNYGDVFQFNSKGYRHQAVILKVTKDSVKIRITSNPIELILLLGETKIVDIDGNGLDDFSVTLNSISKYGGSFTFTILDESIIVEEIPITTPIEEVITETEVIEEEPIVEASDVVLPLPSIEKSYGWVSWAITFIVLAIIGILIAVYKKKNKETKNGKQKA